MLVGPNVAIDLHSTAGPRFCARAFMPCIAGHKLAGQAHPGTCWLNVNTHSLQGFTSKQRTKKFVRNGHESKAKSTPSEHPNPH